MPNNRISNDLLYNSLNELRVSNEVGHKAIKDKLDDLIPVVATHDEAIKNNKETLKKLDERFWYIVAAIVVSVLTKVANVW